jgi:hypothetical protein
MTARIYGLPPDAPVDVEQDRIDRIIVFWNELSVADDTGATTREVLDEIGFQVTECLNQETPDIPKAFSLTAKAFHLIAGTNDL